MQRLSTLRARPPETRFTKGGATSIAYQVAGRGETDLVLVPGFVSHLEQNWLNPFAAHFLERLSSFSRLIMFDKRGTGLSDRAGGTLSMEERMEDIGAVMDAVGSTRAVLLGVSEGGSMSILFAATHPQRVSALIVYGGVARGSWALDFPWAGRPEDLGRLEKEWQQEWGGPVNVGVWAPSLAEDDHFRQWFARYMRLASSPREVMNQIRMMSAIDVRPRLSALRVPTLVIHRADDRAVNVEHGRYLGTHIPGATYREIPGNDHLWYVGDMDSILTEIRCFVTGEQKAFEADDMLADLSPREIEIAVLLARRLSTAEIADQLFISPRTVSKHLEHIYMKLRASRRSDVRQILLAGNQAVDIDAYW